MTNTVPVKISAKDVKVFYGENQALHGISMDVYQNEVISFIGPSGCGKSTFLRCMNRMNDTIEHCRVTGSITL
ncbi:MAG: ATP-binding cassette domain-containing protein, partial [Gammaproteobacteria bacterium]|nr:ATP-binding cassette domain-containing protein [Gammaproteobacteria bacterium]